MRIGLIAGSGQFPIIFSKAAKSKGFAVYAAAYLNETDPALKEHVEVIEWMHIGQLKRLIMFFKKNNIRCFIKGGFKRLEETINIKEEGDKSGRTKNFLNKKNNEIFNYIAPKKWGAIWMAWAKPQEEQDEYGIENRRCEMNGNKKIEKRLNGNDKDFDQTFDDEGKYYQI